MAPPRRQPAGTLESFPVLWVDHRSRGCCVDFLDLDPVSTSSPDRLAPPPPRLRGGAAPEFLSSHPPPPRDMDHAPPLRTAPPPPTLAPRPTPPRSPSGAARSSAESTRCRRAWWRHTVLCQCRYRLVRAEAMARMLPSKTQLRAHWEHDARGQWRARAAGAGERRRPDLCVQWKGALRHGR
eukprot:3592735-Rhodomonas_salina.1